MTAATKGLAPPGEVSGRPGGATGRGASNGRSSTARATVAELRVRDVKRSIPGFDVWRWRAEDRRVCEGGWHEYTQLCPEHGCPWCFVEACEGYYGECAKCDALTDEEYPDPECVNGDECLICEQCYLPGVSAPEAHRCLCKVPICRHCGLCADHAQKPAGYRGRPGDGGYAVDELGAPLDCRHSWRDPITGRWS